MQGSQLMLCSQQVLSTLLSRTRLRILLAAIAKAKATMSWPDATRDVLLISD
jgi:hypothetical protein